MVGAEGLSGRAGRRQLIGQPALVEPDGKGTHRLVAQLRHERQHGARVEPSRQETPERHVADEAPLDGDTHQVLHVIGGLGERRRQLGAILQAPPALDLQPIVAYDHLVARRKLTYASEEGTRGRHVAQRQVVLERGVVEIHGDARSQKGLDLGAEHELIAVL
jgi:hypothetical protein